MRATIHINDETPIKWEADSLYHMIQVGEEDAFIELFFKSASDIDRMVRRLTSLKEEFTD